MHKLIEKNKTYRIPKKDGDADLYHVLLVMKDLVKAKDIKTNGIKIFKKSQFQKDLDEGRIYVAAKPARLLIKAFKLLLRNKM